MKTTHKVNKNNSLDIASQEAPANAFDADRFVDILRQNGKDVTEDQKSLIERYVSGLRGWNEKVNLVSRKDAENIWLRHILASVLFLAKHEFAPGTRLLDLGTGGGLPGIPIAILCPAVDVLLVDSIAKKIRAVDDILGQLKLPNVTTVCSRVEDLRGGQYEGTFDYVIARAVAPIADVVGWSKRLLRRRPAAEAVGRIPRSSVILLKGGELETEIAAARKLHSPAEIVIEPLDGKGLVQGELPDKKIIIIRL